MQDLASPLKSGLLKIQPSVQKAQDPYSYATKMQTRKRNLRIKKGRNRSDS